MVDSYEWVKPWLGLGGVYAMGGCNSRALSASGYKSDSREFDPR